MDSDMIRARERVRRRAFGNLILCVDDEARRSGGRLGIVPVHDEAIAVAFRDVRTLVRAGDAPRVATRDFMVVLGCPPQWPFDRSARLLPVVLTPDDFVHPNSDGHALCLDLAGVLPEQLPALLYDNFRLRRFRLDHPVDPAAAAFVRTHRELCPTDPRPLVGTGAAA